MSNDFWDFDGAPSPPVSDCTSVAISSITSGETSEAHSFNLGDKPSSDFETPRSQRLVIWPDVGDNSKHRTNETNEREPILHCRKKKQGKEGHHPLLGDM